MTGVRYPVTTFRFITARIKFNFVVSVEGRMVDGRLATFGRWLRTRNQTITIYQR